MKLTDEEKTMYKEKALELCNKALESLDKMAEEYMKQENIDLVGAVVIPPLADLYYSVKKNVISREDAIAGQKALLDMIELEDE